MIRLFEERDAERIVAIGAAINPELPPSLIAFQYRDRTWNPEYHKLRLVATRGDEVVAWAQVAHMWWAYHPRRFVLRIEVDPAAQRTGLGSALHERLLAQLAEWQADLVRCDTRAARNDAVAWLQRRGYSEIQRRLELRLLLDAIDLASLGDPEQLVRASDIRVTTFGAEHALRGDELVRELYEVEVAGGEDEPRPEQDIAMSFDRFVSQELEQPQALPDGHFLACHGGRLVGVSRLERDLARPWALLQGFTTVHPSYRGRGIARALKLCTVRYAVVNGYREVGTANDVTNAPMLHINRALGFREVAQDVVFERRLARS